MKNDEKKTLVIVYGPADHVFSLKLEEMSQNQSANITVEIYPVWPDLINRLDSLKEASILLINKNEKEALKVLTACPECRVLMCHGGKEKFQSNLIWLKSDLKHEYFTFENWDDFTQKIIKTTPNLNPLLESSQEKDEYRINYQNFPELKEHQKLMVNKKFFWFSIYFSKLYLKWYSDWSEEMVKKEWTINLSFSEKGKIKRLEIPFLNTYKGELIFREGEDIVLHINNSEITGRILSSDEEMLEINLPQKTQKTALRGQVLISKGNSILKQTIDHYRHVCAGYSDLSEKDFIFSEDDHYSKPEDFLRGYRPNSNPLNWPNYSIKLTNSAKKILYDPSQMRALMEMLGPSYLSLIEGGPGTGKTLVTSIAGMKFIESGTILVSSHSNQGLDQLIEKLMEQVDSRLIFRLGNNPEMISSEKIQKLHRRFRYKKALEIAKKQWAKNKVKQEDQEYFDEEDFLLKQENENIWRLLCEGKKIILAVTINSFVFDKEIAKLYQQNITILKTEFFRPTENLNDAPQALVKFMQTEERRNKLFFGIDIAIIDEATKIRFPELVPILKKTLYKLVLIGDTDQLGNISLSLEIEKEILAMASKQCKENTGEPGLTIFPEKMSPGDHSLAPLKTTPEEIISWFRCFSEGVFTSLLKNGGLPSNRLETNRRSLEKIVKFLNFVFEKNMKVGRFDPFSEGSVTFINVAGQEEKIKNSYRNPLEKQLIIRETIKTFKNQEKLKLNSLGIITTYQGQIKLIKERLRKDLLFHLIFKDLINPQNINQIISELVNTVDRFQGSERENIIVSLVCANENGRIGFVKDPRRLYVALSRAGNNLIIFGNSKTFLQSQDEKTRKIVGRIINFTQINKTYCVKK